MTQPFENDVHHILPNTAVTTTVIATLNNTNDQKSRTSFASICSTRLQLLITLKALNHEKQMH